jgi:carboxymethylenebutenolidase
MSHWTDVDTVHGPIRAWRAEPAGPSRGAVVVLQEIFGVNPHIRQVTERFAAEGFAALAPALYDPVERDVQLEYDDGGFARGRALAASLGFDRAVEGVAAAAGCLQQEGLRTGVVGFCWGGSVAFLANTRLGLPAVSYYGARTVPFLDEPARAPLLFHFGEHDAATPPQDIALHRQKQPGAQVCTYPAGHGFNRDVDSRAYEPRSAALAWERTIAFLSENLR